MRSAKDDLQNTRQNRQDIAEEQVSFDRPSRNQSTAICTDRIAKHNSNSINKEEKSHLEPHQLHRSCKPSRIRRQSDDT